MNYPSIRNLERAPEILCQPEIAKYTSNELVLRKPILFGRMQESKECLQGIHLKLRADHNGVSVSGP